MNGIAPRPPARSARPPLAAALAIAGTVLICGCGSEPPRPVGRLAVTPSEVSLAHAGSARLSAEWTMTAPLSGEGDAAAEGPRPRVFVHLLDAEGQILRTFDHALAFPWRAGETSESPIELWQSALAPPLPPGEYRLTVGLYDPETGSRWSLETGEKGRAPEVDEGEYAVARVRVPPAVPGVEVSYEGSWWPGEAGADRQVLARRWLRKDGSLALADLPPAARLVLGLRVPEPGKGERRVLDEGAGGVRLRVSSPCAAEGAVVEGAGDHQVALDLRPPEDGRCTVRLEPSFVIVDLDSLASRSVALERLTVSPGDG